jgi:protein-tyrosine phosphatase
MEELNKKLFTCLVNLDTFSRLPPNTDVHLSKNNYFVPTAGKLSGIIGAQTISNLYNNYTFEKLLSDMECFAYHLIALLDNLYNMTSKETQTETACKIKLFDREFKFAYKGLSYLVNNYKELSTSVDYMKTNLKRLKKNTQSWLVKDINHLPYCPEDDFTDKDWQLYMQNSTQLSYECTGLYKFYILYSSSLLYNQMMSTLGMRHWFDKIYEFTNCSLYLGAMPLKTSYLGVETRNDLKIIKDLNIKAVLSVVESFENNSEGFVHKPINPSEWKEEGIDYLQVPIEDFIDISIEKIQICLAFIHWNILKNKSVYVNCRVAVNRSVLIVMAYLVKYLKFSALGAFDYIKSIRVQVENGHFETLKKFEAMLCK